MEAMASNERFGSALAPLGLAGGALLLVQGIAAAFTDQSANYSATSGDALADGLLAAGLALTLAGMQWLRRRTEPRLGALAMAGQAAIVVAILATIAAGHEVLDGVYIAGTVAWVIGGIGVAAAALRTREPALRGAALLPFGALAALALSDSGGAILLALMWALLAARR